MTEPDREHDRIRPQTSDRSRSLERGHGRARDGADSYRPDRDLHKDRRRRSRSRSRSQSPHATKRHYHRHRSRSHSRHRRDKGDWKEREREPERHARSRSRSRSRLRHKRRRSRSRSRSSSFSSRDSDHDRHRKKAKDKHRKKRIRSGSKDSKSKDEKKKRKDKKSKKKAPEGMQWGKYGIISEANMYDKAAEFHTWLVEERVINPETLSKEQSKKEFAQFVEDYNTATLPHEKYYNMAAYERRMTSVRAGETLPLADDAYDPNADMLAHSIAIKKSAGGSTSSESHLTREQLQELRRVRAERAQVSKMKLMGMDVKQSFGMRMDGTVFDD